MAYNVLGINPGHNGSAAVVSDGKLVYYLEEERLSKLKRDGNPFRVIIDICSKYKIDKLVIGGTNDPNESYLLSWTNENPFTSLVRKYYPEVETVEARREHHSLHAYCAFLNSGFKKSSIIIIDGAGSGNLYQSALINEEDEIVSKTNDPFYIFECESIWEGIEQNLEIVGKVYFSPREATIDNGNNHISNGITITKAYEAVTHYLGWNGIEAGKTMGLSPYGEFNPSLPPLFKNSRGNKNLFIPDYPGHAYINEKDNPVFQRDTHPQEWHTDPSKLSKIETDLAWQIQNDTQEEVAKLIETSLRLTNNKQICIAGGYGLNCVTNYWLKKRFPDLEIYHEPVSHDGGTAIGAAYLGWVDHNKNNNLKINIPPQTSIYYGPKYKTSQYLPIIKSYNNIFTQHKITPEQVAKLISERNIVTIFQGRSEAGPRALGNRSILYDPTDPNGKDYVNKVKNREWFRPFAGSVLKEKAAEWFDMAGLEESPFMMYAMDVWPDKQEKIKAITHVDGTCRIQTVTEEQNPHYYKLIQEFEKITGVPILFNTSFNLAGDPLVETIEDALETMLKSEMKYLYLPELEMLLEKK
jgi:carbamoyltransferase